MANYDVYPPFNYKLGRPLKYKPDELLEKFAEYVTWAKEHPIPIVRKVTSTTTEGKVYGSDTEEHKPRLLSIGGFLVFLGAGSDWWQSLDREDRKRCDEFARVKSFIREFCEDYQKEMASAEIFNANIISRLLGLADKKEVENKGTSTIVVRSEEEKKKLENIGNLGV